MTAAHHTTIAISYDGEAVEPSRRARTNVTARATAANPRRRKIR
jgi:hypothetical protein